MSFASKLGQHYFGVYHRFQISLTAYSFRIAGFGLALHRSSWEFTGISSAFPVSFLWHLWLVALVFIGLALSVAVGHEQEAEDH